MAWAHFADIGGLRAGSISPDTTDIFQEGIIVPPTKLIDRGQTNDAALAIFHRNSRFPDQSLGDMRALMASVQLGVRRVDEILARFGADVVADALRQLLARTRRLVRAELAETFPLRHASLHRRDRFRRPRQRPVPYPLRADPRSRPRRRGPLHLRCHRDRRPGRRAGELPDEPDVPGMALGLYYLGGDPTQVCNAGGPNALDEVRLREGSLLWPRFPAPLGMRGLTMMRVLAALNGLINVAGGGAPAAHSAYVINLLRGTFRDQDGELQPFLLADGIGVGYGARPTADGIDAVYFVAQENYPVEFLEIGYPVRMRTYGMVCDSGGAGRYRGGCGIVREYEMLAEEAVLAVRIDSVQESALGHRRRQAGRRRPGRRSIPARSDERVLVPLSDGNRRAARRRAAHRDRRRRRTWPSVRPPGRGGAGGCAGRLRQRRGGAGGIWRSDRRWGGRCVPPPLRCATGGRQWGLSIATPMSRLWPDVADFAVAVDIGGTFTDIALHDRVSGADVAGQDAERAGGSLAGVHDRRAAGAGTRPAWRPLPCSACCTAPRSPPT